MDFIINAVNKIILCIFIFILRRYGNNKLTSFSIDASCIDESAMSVNGLFDGHETQAGSCITLCAEECTEQLGADAFGNAAAVV